MRLRQSARTGAQRQIKMAAFIQSISMEARESFILICWTHELIVYTPEGGIEGAQKISYLGFEDSYRIALKPYDDHLDILNAYYEAHENGGIIPNDGCNIDRQVNIIETIEKLYEASATGYKMDVF